MANDGFLDALPWALLGGAAGAGLYFLLKPARAAAPPPGETRAAPLPPAAPPARFANFESADIRLGQVRELYRMGHMSPEQALSETSAVEAAAAAFLAQGVATKTAVDDLVARSGAFRRQIEDFIRMRGQGVVGGAAPAMSSARFPVLNRRIP
jgi:hypothetical protein